MAIEDITKRIISDAEKEADQIIDEAQALASKIVNNTKVKAQEKILQRLNQAREELKHHQNKEIVKARIDSRNKILQVKQNLLSEAYKKANKTLLELKDDSYRQLLLGLIKTYVTDGEELIFSQNDVDLGKNIISSLNEYGKNITVSQETRQISGGFISKKGEIETNFSFEALFDSKKEEYQARLVEIMGLQ